MLFIKLIEKGSDIMKRRKNVNKYSIGEHGQITNNNPHISERTKMVLDLLSFGSMVNGGLFTNGESYTVDDVDVTEEVTEADTTSTDENINEDNKEDIKDEEE